MANPVSVSCPENQWTKVATAVYRGNVYVQDPVGSMIFATYRETGDAAPTTIDDASEGSRLDRFIIDSTPAELVDIYIWPQNVTADVKVSV